MLTVMVALAALSFSAAGYFMKLSNGLTVLAPSVLLFALVLFGTSLQTLAMRAEQMTVIYVMVLGLEVISASLLGVVFLRESSSPGKLVGIALVLAGVVVLHVKA